jgi:5-methylthioribose kinase
LFELSAHNACDYLARRAETARRSWRITPLEGGVSNTVLLAESDGDRIVLKQALAKLRVKEDWHADRSRIRRECNALRLLAPLLAPGAVPRIVFEDEENCLFAMEAAPRGARTWKALLLEGQAPIEIAESVGAMTAAMLRQSWGSSEWEELFGDQTAFDQLRLDPYYRFTATRHPDLAPQFAERIELAGRRHALVHGDWSPKNFLVWGGRVTAIDFEVIHYGDPSFDAAFLLNHLLLKSFYRPQWAPRYAASAERFLEIATTAVPAAADFEWATLRHLGCLLLARIDGKSPVEYIQEEGLKARIRTFARRLILEPPPSAAAVFASIPS